MEKRPQLVNNEQGMALVTVLIVIMVGIVLGMGLMGLAISNFKMSTGDRDQQSTYYIAESGATYLLSDVTKKINEAYDTAKTKDEFFNQVKTKFTNNHFYTEQSLSSFEKNFGNQPVAKYRLEVVDEEKGKYKIVSTGTVDNRTRTVEQEFQLRWSILFPKTAVFVDGNITVDSGSSIINGSIGTNSIADNAITLHDSKSLQTGSEIIVGPNAPNQGRDVVNLNTFTNIKVLEDKVSIDLKDFKDTPPIDYPATVTLKVNDTDNVIRNVKTNSGNLSINEANKSITSWTLNETIKLNDLNVGDKNTLNINIGNQNIDLFVNNLNVNGTLNVVGTGTLSIYINGGLTFQNGIINEDKYQKDNLTLYLRKSTTGTPKTITASSTPTGINCNIFAEDAKFDFTGGTFRGRFVTGGTVEIGGNNTIEGSIIAENLHLKGNSSITFVEEDAFLPLPAFKINPLERSAIREK